MKKKNEREKKSFWFPQVWVIKKALSLSRKQTQFRSAAFFANVVRSFTGQEIEHQRWALRQVWVGFPVIGAT